jgi:hypothetical protein
MTSFSVVGGSLERLLGAYVVLYLSCGVEYAGDHLVEIVFGWK